MKRFYKLLNKLRKLNPPYPIVVRVVKPHEAFNLWGDCDFDGKKFILRIVKGNVDVMNLILVHEFAHTFTFNNQDVHGPEWGIAFARCWRVYCGDPL